MHPVVKIPEVKNIQLKTNAKMARGLDLSQCWYYWYDKNNKNKNNTNSKDFCFGAAFFCCI